MSLPWLNQVFQFVAFGRYNTTPPVIANGVANELQTDASGNLCVNIAGNGGSTPAGWVDTTALAYQQIVKASSAKLFSINGSNEGTAKRWIQIFNSAAFVANASVPVFQVPVFAGGSFNIELPRGRTFPSGVVWMISSTSATLTVDAAATFWVNSEVV